jgi:hypothetical protein
MVVDTNKSPDFAGLYFEFLSDSVTIFITSLSLEDIFISPILSNTTVSAVPLEVTRISYNGDIGLFLILFVHATFCINEFISKRALLDEEELELSGLLASVDLLFVSGALLLGVLFLVKFDFLGVLLMFFLFLLSSITRPS